MLSTREMKCQSLTFLCPHLKLANIDARIRIMCRGVIWKLFDIQKRIHSPV